MGFLTLLRNTFGRSRKAKTAPAEGAVPQPTTEPAPEPAPEAVPDPATEPAPAPTAESVPAPAAESVPAPAAEPIPAPAAEKAPSEHAAEPSPDPRPAAPEEHELVVAAFDKVAVPRPARAPEQEESEGSTGSGTEPKETAQALESATSGTEPKGTAQAPEPATSGTESAPEPQTVPEPTAPDPVPASEPAAPTPDSATPETEPAPEQQPAPEPTTPATPETEPTPEQQPTPEPTTPATDPAPAATAPTPSAPAATHGERAPRESPAPGDESRTEGTEGTAGKASPAESEAESEAESGAEGGAEVRKPAVSAARLRSRAPHLSPAYKAAGAVLRKRGLTGARAKVYLVLDRSASMRPYYKDGSAQALAEQTLALAAHLDPEATVPVVFFSTELDGTGELTLTRHENRIDELHGALGRMGRTSYHAAVAEVVARHAEHEKAAPGTPALVVFQTDGAPDAKTPATRALAEAAESHPSLFFSFVAFGDPENKAFDYLRKLKAGNASHFLAGEAPRELTDKEMYEGLLASWRP
ncbi:hypothetical protein SUDANB58_02802 [Streptomyces sp. enrichment culture]|uniref:VWA domain-containing protein n=1 Tax=Streptomyces sp. enrichment culture TaxID=1795815 RepID=UPI003F5720C8